MDGGPVPAVLCSPHEGEKQTATFAVAEGQAAQVKVHGVMTVELSRGQLGAQGRWVGQVHLSADVNTEEGECPGRHHMGAC